MEQKYIVRGQIDRTLADTKELSIISNNTPSKIDEVGQMRNFMDRVKAGYEAFFGMDDAIRTIGDITLNPTIAKGKLRSVTVAQLQKKILLDMARGKWGRNKKTNIPLYVDGVYIWDWREILELKLGRGDVQGGGGLRPDDLTAARLAVLGIPYLWDERTKATFEGEDSPVYNRASHVWQNKSDLKYVMSQGMKLVMKVELSKDQMVPAIASNYAVDMFNAGMADPSISDGIRKGISDRMFRICKRAQVNVSDVMNCYEDNATYLRPSYKPMEKRIPKKRESGEGKEKEKEDDFV